MLAMSTLQACWLAWRCCHHVFSRGCQILASFQIVKFGELDGFGFGVGFVACGELVFVVPNVLGGCAFGEE